MIFEDSVSLDPEMMPVLNHGGVKLMGAMADDLDVVGAARVSYATEPEAASKGEEQDAKLIRYLMSHGHGSPFEHASFRFFVKAPIFVFREWHRHRIGSFNEMSGRYTEFKPEYYIPEHFRRPDPDNKQGSVLIIPETEKELEAEDELQRMMYDSCEQALVTYNALLMEGVAREIARMVLPVSMYSMMWWSVNARSLMNFLALRNHPAAQWEIREYAKAVEALFSAAMPVTHAAFVERGRVAP